MCGLFGFTDYKHRQSEGFLNTLCNSLAKESEARGSHAAGIAYVNKGVLEIYKQPLPASKIEFTIPKNTSAVMGHTRHATHGSEKENCNNHPFFGRVGNTRFAFAHNGVLCNHRLVRHELKLPDTAIETDSYIGVQLLESQKELSLQSHKYMAEQLQGSYMFTTLDDRNNLYITKGESPISVIHFKDKGLYVYASTEEILWKSIMKTSLFGYVKNELAHGKRNNIEFVEMQDGEILKLAPNGSMSRCGFQMPEYEFNCDWYNYRSSYVGYTGTENDYLQAVIQTAAGLGICAEDIELLTEMGFAPEEIEELIYEPDMFNQYVDEFRCDFGLA